MADGINSLTPFPFGKYKGRAIGEVMNDRSYVDWLLTQADFTLRNPALADYLRNGPAKEDSCTPAHNAMQVRYLDKAYCGRLLNLIENTKGELTKARKELPPLETTLQNLTVAKEEAEANLKVETENFENHIKVYDDRIQMAKLEFEKAKSEDREFGRSLYREGSKTDLANGRYGEAMREKEKFQQSLNSAKNACSSATEATTEATEKVKAAKDWIERLENLLADPASWNANVQFERNNWDVVINERPIELKPCISEDYPAIIRKVTQRCQFNGGRWPIVITDRYTGTSATLAQVKQMFAASGIGLLLSSDFEELPDWLTGGAS